MHTSVVVSEVVQLLSAVESVTWECPGEKAEGKRRRLLSQAAPKHAPSEEGAGHCKKAAASPDAQTTASNPPAEGNRGLHQSVSFSGGCLCFASPVLGGVILCCTVGHNRCVPSVVSRSAARHGMWAWAPLAEVSHAQQHQQAPAVGGLALLHTDADSGSF